jgi:LuxR family maltose regulon positive regulatory protein
LLYEWNDLEAAADHLREGIELSQRSGNVEVQTGGYRMLARLKQAQGNASAALAALQEAHQLARDHDVTPLVRARNAACHAQIALAQGDLAMATHWAEQVTEDADAFPLYPFLRLTPARLLLAQNQKAAAAEELEALYETAVGAGWQFGVVEVRALQALAAPTPTVALPFLADALTLAQPEGFVRTFVDKGEPMAALLQEAASQGIATDYVSKLLAAMYAEEQRRKGAEEKAITPAPSLPRPPALIEPLRRRPKITSVFEQGFPKGKSEVISGQVLSERELEVLELLVEGRTYREIARELCVSINTVKTHLKNIYGKLRVNNRREAAAQAKKLGLVA